MIPKLAVFASGAYRWLLLLPGFRRSWAAVAAWISAPLWKARSYAGHRSGGHDTKLDLGVVGEKKRQSVLSGINALRISRPDVPYRNVLQVRLVELRRPVDVTAWLKEVCIFPVCGLINSGRASI